MSGKIYFMITSSIKNEIARQRNNVLIIMVMQSYVDINGRICLLICLKVGSIIEATNRLKLQKLIFLMVKTRNLSLVIAFLNIFRQLLTRISNINMAM
jgi:hypothetical protein